MVYEEVKRNKKIVASYIILASVTVFMFLPFIWLIFTPFDAAASVSVKFPERFTTVHLMKAFSGTSLQWLKNSLFISISSATIGLLFTVFAAYPFSRFKFPGSDALLWVFVLLRVFPLTAYIVPMYVLLAGMGLANTHLGVILVMVALNLPLSLLLMKGFYDTVPISYEEAAWVDGQSRWRSILGVLLPICAPGMAVVWLMGFIFTWGNFLIPLVLLRSPASYPLSVGLYSSFSQHGVINYGLLTALSLIYLLPPLLIYLYGRRWLVRGMAGLTLR